LGGGGGVGAREGGRKTRAKNQISLSARGGERAAEPPRGLEEPWGANGLRQSKGKISVSGGKERSAYSTARGLQDGRNQGAGCPQWKTVGSARSAGRAQPGIGPGAFS